MADATEYKDVFLLKSAYSKLQMIMDYQKEEFTRDLMAYYDYAINTNDKDSVTPLTYVDEEFYKDPTYTRTISHRIVDLFYKAKEQVRLQAAYKDSDITQGLFYGDKINDSENGLADYEGSDVKVNRFF